jgi:hypothetical protein
MKTTENFLYGEVVRMWTNVTSHSDEDIQRVCNNKDAKGFQNLTGFTDSEIENFSFILSQYA